MRTEQATRPSSRRIPAILLAALLLGVQAAHAVGVQAAKAVEFSGRVVEVATGRPVEGAAVIVERSLQEIEKSAWPPWAGESTVRTDADGRFRLSFPAEQVADRRLEILVRVRHPGFVARKSRRLRLVDVIRWQETSLGSFFQGIELERGVEYKAQVVTPAGKPAAGLPYVFETWDQPDTRSNNFTSEQSGETDDQGRIRLRMPRRHTLAIHLGPARVARARFPFASYRHFWGTDSSSHAPELWAPTDLGRIVLKRGIRLVGRVIDTEGRPLGGQAIEATALKGQDRHSTTTEAEGTFALGPLRPANYLIHGAWQYPGDNLDFTAPSVRGPIRPIRPVQVFLKEGETPDPLVLQELPSVRLEIQFVDSAGRPAAGGPVILWGTITTEANAANRGLRNVIRQGLASEINDPEAPEPATDHGWSVLERPGADGRIVIAAPMKLHPAVLYPQMHSEGFVYRVRATPDGTLQENNAIVLGPLDEDRRVTVECYRAPRLIVRVEREDGESCDGAMVGAIGPGDRRDRTFNFVTEKGGLFRGMGLYPDREYEIYALQRGPLYYSKGLKRVRLSEGETVELKLTLHKRPSRPVVGQPAPGFSVRTVNGKEVSLESLRGKTVLLHFWTPNLTSRLGSLKALHDRFAGDDRFAMIGFCLDRDVDAARNAVEFFGLSWPQAVLRDRDFDPIVVSYAARKPFPGYVIGPDGKLLGVAAEGPALDKAVADALPKR